MFGYHDSNHCAFDLWSPVNSSNAIENRAFSAYAYHTSQLDNIVEQIANGMGSVSISDDITEDDLIYIKHQLRTVYGLDAELSLN